MNCYWGPEIEKKESRRDNSINWFLQQKSRKHSSHLSKKIFFLFLFFFQMKAEVHPKAKPKQKDYCGAKSNLHELSEAAFVELVALGQNTTPTLSFQRHI